MCRNLNCQMINHDYSVQVQTMERNQWTRPHRIRFDGRFCGRCRRRCYAGRLDEHQHDLVKGGLSIESCIYARELEARGRSDCFEY